MQALYLKAHGGAEAVELGLLPDPHAGPGQVRVRVRAAALNHLDLWVRAGWPALKLKFPHVLGADMAGEVDGVGAGVDPDLQGKRVVIVPGLSCGTCSQCLAGQDNLCRQFKLMGEHAGGGQAEYHVVPARNVLPLPNEVSFVQAAALPVTFQTAWNMLATKTTLDPASWVLVHAAGSGVGSAAVQIAKLFGATVIATAGSDEKCGRAKALGADHVVNYTSQDFLDEVRRLTGKRGVEVVFEHTGQATWEKSVRALATGGVLVTCGATTGYVGNVDIRYLFARQISIIGSTMGTRAELARIVDLVAQKRLDPVVDRVLPLSEGKAAQALLESRTTFGKIVLEP
jgi:NADPH:quinone reductase-like Zn-dependent oxidoreductase